MVIHENAQPVMSPIKKLPLPLLDQLKSTIDDIERKQILAKVTGPSDWVHPLVLIKKPNDQLRICIDPKYLNAALKREHCAIDTFDEISSKLENAKFFSTLDAVNGFYQIPMDAPSADIRTDGPPFGRYKVLRLSVWCKNCS